MMLTGQSGSTYQIQTSTNLVNWSAAGTLLDTNGSVIFIDNSESPTTRRFYRARLLP
jgi:hypothetical protein